MADAVLPASPPTRGVELEIDDRVLQALRDELPSVAMQTVAAITVEVPSYTGALSGSMGANITAAVQMALAGFLKLAARSGASDPSTPLDATREGAYALGRGEARSGRSVDALLAAYRVGARVAWRELAQTAARTGLGAETMAEFAELVFAYIDELSAASVAGHTDELSTSGRVRERYLARLGQDLLAGARPDVLTAAAERAGWTPPRTLTAVLLPAAQVRGAVSTLNPDTLQVGEDLPGLPGVPGRDAGDERALLLVPDMEGAGRGHLLRVLQGRSAIVGPARSWTQARSSYLRTVRALELTGARTTGTGSPGAGTDPVVPVHPVEPIDTEEHLADLVLSADPEALADLREAVLAPLAGLRPGTAQRLAETLHAWLLHQGRRDAVAEHLHVHAQTVRYRMGQLRELYGDRLDDPRTVLELVLALQPGGLGADASPLA